MNSLHRYNVYIFLLLFGLVSMSSCNISGTNWDIDGVAPVMETTLDFTKMVGQENLDVAPDSALTLHFTDTVYRFELDTLSKLPITDVVNPFYWPWNTIEVPPGTALPTQTFVVSLDLNDVQLMHAIIKTGTVRLLVKSKLPHKLLFRYYIPKATLNGNQFEIVDSIMPNLSGDTAYYIKELPANGYHLDLRGPNNNQVNRLDVFVDVTLDPYDDTLILVQNQFVFEIRNNFLDIVPYYGKGYLGQYSFQSGDNTVDLDFMRKFRSGWVDLQGVNLDLKFINHVGADMRFKPHYLKAFNTRQGTSVDLSHPSLGTTININRATETGIFSNPVTPAIYNLQFNAGNSNLEQLVEILPDQVVFNSDLFLNPYGNISGLGDFYFYDYPSMVWMDLTAPLKFSIHDVWFADTLDNMLFDEQQLDHVKSGEVRVVAENKFPLEAILQVYTLDAAGLVTDSLLADNVIDAAPVNASGRVISPVSSTVNLVITPAKLDHLKTADRLLIKAFFVTLPSAQLLQMYEDYYLHLKLIGDIRYNVVL